MPNATPTPIPDAGVPLLCDLIVNTSVTMFVAADSLLIVSVPDVSSSALFFKKTSSTERTIVPLPTAADKLLPASDEPVTTAGVLPPTIISPLFDKSTEVIADVPFPNSIPLFVRVVTPVPPSPTESVPVILDAPKSMANSVDSITIPPFVLMSVESVFPDLIKPSPAVIFSAPENSLHTILSLPRLLTVDVIT